MKKIEIQVPDGHDLVKDGDVFRLVKNELPTSWEELSRVEGWHVVGSNSITSYFRGSTKTIHRNIFATKEQAEAAIALAQITQLLKAYNGDWKADWSDGTVKWCIIKYRKEYSIEALAEINVLLAFPTREKCKHFLEHHRELIEKASPLLFG
ncbi:MAG TPA: hypothetical protein VKP88_08035 [Candidatus Paceibacterota bacterium]|nr:hypothetical protein [Candidatus Paceibacterota bacterium]